MHVDVGVLNTPPTYPWPTFPFGTVRMTSTETKWSQIDKGGGNYDFSTLDQWRKLYQQNGNYDIIYTIYSVPTYISCNPSDSCSFGSSSDHTPGSCDPPTDLNPDGTGTDQTFKNFITAIANHVNSDSLPKIHRWEMWNEPNNFTLWNGTLAQLVRMAQDARSIILKIDPTAQMLTPTPVTTTDQSNPALNSPSGWMSAYLAAGGGQYADIFSFHGYVEPGHPVEGVFDVANQFQVVASGSDASKPIWDTELGYSTADISDPDLQAGWLARAYLLQPGLGVKRVTWFEYGATNFGTLYVPGIGLNAAGNAYGVLYGWLNGATPTGPCTSSGDVWTCDFTLSGGVAAQAVWDASLTCSGGNCTTSPFTPDPVYIKYEDLQGVLHTISGLTVQIGAKPILLKSL